jgi:hypothetical protein
MAGGVGRYTLLFLALGLVLWAYQKKVQAPPDPPRLPDHPLIRAKLESEELLNDGLAIARALLIKDGEFQPFASGLTNRREVERVAGLSRGKRSSREIVELLEKSLRGEADERNYRAIAIVSDVRFEIEGDPEPKAAVQVTLEHREGYCVDVIARYTRRDDTLEFDRLMASPRSGRVFLDCQPSTPAASDRGDLVRS